MFECMNRRGTCSKSRPCRHFKKCLTSLAVLTHEQLLGQYPLVEIVYAGSAFWTGASSVHAHISMRFDTIKHAAPPGLATNFQACFIVGTCSFGLLLHLIGHIWTCLRKLLTLYLLHSVWRCFFKFIMWGTYRNGEPRSNHLKKLDQPPLCQILKTVLFVLVVQ